MDQERRPRRAEAAGVFGLPPKRLRTISRICHLTFEMLLMPYIYSPSAKFLLRVGRADRAVW
jgi:hypothetical protein